MLQRAETHREQAGPKLDHRDASLGVGKALPKQGPHEAWALSGGCDVQVYTVSPIASWCLLPLNCPGLLASCMTCRGASRKALCSQSHILQSLVGCVCGQQSLSLLWGQVSLATHAVRDAEMTLCDLMHATSCSGPETCR